MTTNFKSVESVFTRFGSMINTTLILVSACGMIYYMGQKDANTSNDIARIEKKVDDNAADFGAYIVQHEAQVKERFGDNRAIAAATSERINSIEKGQDDILRKFDRTEYRVTMNESAISAQALIQKEATDKLNDIIGDIKVIKEIVTRQDVTTKRIPK